VLAALRQLDGAIDAETMRTMNLQVDVEGADPTTVATAFIDNWTATP